MLESRNNIFMFGANGTGKTTFVQDCIKSLQISHQNENQALFYVYIDCVEFYSEKLISIALSKQLNVAV
jgi:Cdc6-like AAA superfamily ATPase